MLQKLFNPERQITSKSFLLSSFLIGFSFSTTWKISRLELEFEESLPRKTASKRGLDRSQMEQPMKKSKFSYFADLAFGFVHKRSGNEITLYGLHPTICGVIISSGPSQHRNNLLSPRTLSQTLTKHHFFYNSSRTSLNMKLFHNRSSYISLSMLNIVLSLEIIMVLRYSIF